LRELNPNIENPANKEHEQIERYSTTSPKYAKAVKHSQLKIYNEAA